MMDATCAFGDLINAFKCANSEILTPNCEVDISRQKQCKSYLVKINTNALRVRKTNNKKKKNPVVEPLNKLAAMMHIKIHIIIIIII